MQPSVVCQSNKIRDKHFPTPPKMECLQKRSRASVITVVPSAVVSDSQLPSDPELFCVFLSRRIRFRPLVGVAC